MKSTTGHMVGISMTRLHRAQTSGTAVTLHRHIAKCSSAATDHGPADESISRGRPDTETCLSRCGSWINISLRTSSFSSSIEVARAIDELQHAATVLQSFGEIGHTRAIPHERQKGGSVKSC